MIVWLDAQLPPTMAVWISDNFQVQAHSLKNLGLRDASDQDIFMAARAAGAILISKDSDFVDLVQLHGAPPQLVWVTCGNVTNAHLRAVFLSAWSKVAAVLASGEAIVELGD